MPNDFNSNHAGHNPHARAHVLGMPFIGSTTTLSAGSVMAPVVVRERSFHNLSQGDTYLMAGGHMMGFDTVEWIDEGDTAPGDPTTISDSVALILNDAEDPWDDRRDLLIGIGGDDECSYHFAAGFGESVDKVDIVTFDAHMDIDTDGLHHGSWVRAALEDGVAEEVFHYGARGPQNASAGTRLPGYARVVDFARVRRPSNPNNKPLILAVDMDVFDPSVAPGVGWRVPGAGFQAHELLDAIRDIALYRNVIGLVLTEFSPDRDYANLTSDLCVSVIHHAVGGFAGSELRQKR